MATTRATGSSDASEHHSDHNDTALRDKEISEQVERIKTAERVPGHTNYYEKEGLRTYGEH